MSTQEKINKAKELVETLLRIIPEDADVAAMQIWQVFDSSTGRTGWHIQWFGTQGASHIGGIVSDFVNEVAELRESA